MNQSTRRLYIENALLTVTSVLFVFFGYLVYRGVQVASTSQIVSYIEVQGETTVNQESTSNPVESQVPEPSQQTTAPGVDYLRPNSVAVLVNKKFSLPAEFVPGSLTLLNLPGADDAMLTEEAASQLKKLFSAAADDGLLLTVLSGYRSYDEQQVVYESFLTGYNEGYADTVSARPGHSEHQTGLGVDIGALNGVCELDACFAETPEGKWLAQNAHDYGFVVRYLKGKEDLTGYEYEPWHLRYFGVGLATELHNSNQTYEEYLGVAGGDYSE